MSPRADNIRLLVSAAYQSIDWLAKEDLHRGFTTGEPDPLQDFLPGVDDIASPEQRRLVEEALGRRVENGGHKVNVALLRSLLRRAAAQNRLQTSRGERMKIVRRITSAAIGLALAASIALSSAPAANAGGITYICTQPGGRYILTSSQWSIDQWRWQWGYFSCNCYAGR